MLFLWLRCIHDIDVLRKKKLYLCWIWQRRLMLSLSQLKEEFWIISRKHHPRQINDFNDCTHPFPSDHGLCWCTNDMTILIFSTNAIPFTGPLVSITEHIQSSPLTLNLCCPISKVTPACTDSTPHWPALSETQQNTHTIGFAQAWSSAPVSMAVQ